jgi:putative GTP pyrophosphokinase
LHLCGEVIEVDDKLAESNNPLAYMSVHYKCKMPSTYQGQRYEKTANVTFEIQVRTLCMHCWAAVSHHLDYKGDWDVPAELKRALALGGLFYVADDEFEHFNAARLASKKSTEAASKPLEQDINLDTISAYLRKKFPDRAAMVSELISDLVREIREAGYQSLGQVDYDVERALGACNPYEQKVVSGRRAYRSGRSPDWLKMKNADAPAVKREAEEDWGKARPVLKRTL